jgi:hypothetical protein
VAELDPKKEKEGPARRHDSQVKYESAGGGSTSEWQCRNQHAPRDTSRLRVRFPGFKLQA